MSLNVNFRTPDSQSRSWLHPGSDSDSVPAANLSWPLSCVFVCMRGYRGMCHAELVLRPSLPFSTRPLSCCLPFPHVSSLSFPHAEMGHLSLTGTQTRTGTLDSARHLIWTVHVGGGLFRCFSWAQEKHWWIRCHLFELTYCRLFGQSAKSAQFSHTTSNFSPIGLHYFWNHHLNNAIHRHNNHWQQWFMGVKLSVQWPAKPFPCQPAHDRQALSKWCTQNPSKWPSIKKADGGIKECKVNVN